VELLERADALAALAAARDAAAGGDGRVVLVVGEPGIGKTALVTRFVDDLDADARSLVGACDDLTIPRPLGPIRDLAGNVSRRFEDAVAHDAPAHEIQQLLVAELELAPAPTVLVLEDVHWADDATLDTITVLGRRIASLPALVVLTCRGGEVPPSLRAALAAIRPDSSNFIELLPLSQRAVASLAGDDAARVYALTGGNPFYVTELLGSPGDDTLPPSVANSVLGRASRLDDDAWRLVELVSVVPGRVRTTVLDSVMPGWAEAAEEPERRQLLAVEPTFVRFRHELARNAIASSLPVAARRRLHAEILEALLSVDADPADIVHHAEAAGAEDVVAEFALVAARRAAALESNREAHSHYRRAAEFADRLPPPEQARLYEELAGAAYAVGRAQDAITAVQRAGDVYAELGDRVALGRCTRVLSRYHWFAGNGAAARAMAAAAVTVLEPLGESVELARAYSGVSQLAMLAEDPGPAITQGKRALELATRLGDEGTRGHALINIGTAYMQVDPSDIETLLAGISVADTVGDRHEAVRGIVNLAYGKLRWVEPAAALEYAQQGLAYAEEHEVHTLGPYAATIVAWLLLRAGEWDEAERIALTETARGVNVPQLLAKTVLAELAVRRGDPDATERLADLSAHAERTGELQRIAPVLELESERALTRGAELPTARLVALVDELRRRELITTRDANRVAAWAAVAGVDVVLEGPTPAPHAAMLLRDWRGAADAFGELGWTYDRALMLSLLDDEESLVEALDIARALGAEPLTHRVSRRLRTLGLRIPRGPRDATRAHPAGLTARQVEVLSLVLDGLTNAEIADRLVVSPRTAEHHVAAVLTKLGAATRRDAARRAAELGL
jgi:DNA-binding CsgD family transcriptional regulator/tetratricopeptide (TPR) repeat protein